MLPSSLSFLLLIWATLQAQFLLQFMTQLPLTSLILLALSLLPPQTLLPLLLSHPIQTHSIPSHPSLHPQFLISPPSMMSSPLQIQLQFSSKHTLAAPRMLLHLCWKSQRLFLLPRLSRHSCQLHHPFLHHRPCFYLHPIPPTHPQLSLARHNQPQPRPFVAPTAPIIHRRNYRIMYALTSSTLAPTNLLACFQVRLKVHVILWPIMFHITVTSLHIALLLPRLVKSQNTISC